MPPLIEILIGLAVLIGSMFLLAWSVVLSRKPDAPAFTRNFWVEGTWPTVIVTGIAIGIVLPIYGATTWGTTPAIAAGIVGLGLAWVFGRMAWRVLDVERRIEPMPWDVVPPVRVLDERAPPPPANDPGTPHHPDRSGSAAA